MKTCGRSRLPKATALAVRASPITYSSRRLVRLRNTSVK